MRRARRLLVAPLTALTVLALAACGGDDGAASTAGTQGSAGTVGTSDTASTSEGTSAAASSASTSSAGTSASATGEGSTTDASTSATSADPTSAGTSGTSGTTAAGPTGDPTTTGVDPTGDSGTTTGGVQDPPPQKEIIFTKPMQGGLPDTAIEAKLIELFGKAVPGSSIRVSLYHWSRVDIANALIAAKQKGVDVQVVLDGTNEDEMGVEWKAVTLLRDGLGAANVTECHDDGKFSACIGDGINHNKYFLFSELSDGSKNVVVQSSANLTTTQLRKHNNMVVIRDDAALYAAYAAYWDDLHAQKQNLDYYHSVDGDTGTKVYFYPRASGDTILSILGNVECTPGTIRVGMAFFTDARLEIAQKLAALRGAGCDVAVILHDDAPDPGDKVLSTLKGAGVGVTLYPEGPNGEGLHSKYLIIHARYAGVDDKRFVWTGSHNYTGPALDANDETLLRLDDPGIIDAFVADWLEIKALAGTF